MPVDRIWLDIMTRRLVQLILGLSLYGAAVGVMVRADLGLGPWSVFHQGLANHTGLTIGLITNGLGALLLLLWIPLRQKPGIGTVGNVLLIGTTADLTLSLLPPIESLPLQAAALVFAILLTGVASGLYIGAGLGPGPRDGLMTGIVRLTGWPIPRVRTGLELVVLGLGWLLGGTVGIGTLLYAFGVGPLVGVFLPLFDVNRSVQKPAAVNT
jgi:uncharacterized membrane protein YczE